MAPGGHERGVSCFLGWQPEGAYAPLFFALAGNYTRTDTLPGFPLLLTYHAGERVEY